MFHSIYITIFINKIKNIWVNNYKLLKLVVILHVYIIFIIIIDMMIYSCCCQIRKVGTVNILFLSDSVSY